MSTTGTPPALGNPRRLLRILEAVASGVRRPASVARLLDLEGRVVRAYLAQAVWIGLAKDQPEPHLTRAGFEQLWLGKRRTAALAELLLEHPVLGQSPTVETVAASLLAAGASASEALARRDARAVLRLTELARKHKPRAHTSTQLALSFAGPAEPRRPSVGASPGEDSLDVYALLLRGLLEHGELRLNTVRGMFDDAGAGEAGLGGYIALALRRGDAERRGDAIVVTPGAIARADLAESVVSIALSDRDFRAWISAPDAALGPEARRCARWGQRLFGQEAPARALPRLLFGRALATVPEAGDAMGALPTTPGAFLDVLPVGPLAVAFPGSTAVLGGGVQWVLQAWRPVVQNPAGVRVPGPLDAHLVVHGGLLAPGVPPPRNIPDQLSLRLRAIRSVPAFAILVALGLLHRRRSLRLRERGDQLVIELPARQELQLDALIGRLAASRAWVVCPGGAPNRWRRLAEAAVELGLLLRVRDLLTVDELLFVRLTTDPEHHELHERLAPLVDLLDDALGR